MAHTQFTNLAADRILHTCGPRVGDPWYKLCGHLYANYRQTDRRDAGVKCCDGVRRLQPDEAE